MAGCLAEIVARHVADDGDRPAVIDAAGAVSYRQLWERSGAVAAWLRSVGVGPGDVVTVQLENRAEAAAVLLGVERVGAVYSPVPLSAGPAELGAMLATAAPAVHVAMTARPAGFDGTVVTVADNAADSAAGAVPMAAVLACGPPPAPVPRGRDDPTHLGFTSGSTGAPNGVLHTNHSLLSTVDAYIERMGFGRDDVFHVPLPVGYSGGLVFGVRLGLQAGGTVVLQQRWDPARMLELVARYGATYTTGTPTHVRDVLAAGSLPALRSLKVYNCGGDHVPPALVEDAVRALPRVFCRSYGMTECHRLATSDRDTPVAELLETNGSVQRGMRVRAVDDDGSPLGPGETGLLEVRGDFLFAGYVTAGRVVRWHEGFYPTGDLGYVTASGSLAVTGRSKDVIVRGGAKIPVPAVEAAIMAHPAVARAALVGAPDERLGETAAAFVVLRAGARGLDLGALCGFLGAAGISKRFWPSRLIVVDQLPLTTTGKVRKAVLRELLRR
jgi:cyclohexanecarboxylate-CoA ligase